VRFYLEGDLFEPMRPLRACAMLRPGKNLLIGQTFSNFMDPDAFPDTLDFQGPNGMVSVRILNCGMDCLSRAQHSMFQWKSPAPISPSRHPNFLPNPMLRPDGAIRLRQEFERATFRSPGYFDPSRLFSRMGEQIPFLDGA